MTLEQELNIRYKKGLAEGNDKANRATARRMLADNEPVERICRYSGLSEAEVLGLQKEMQ